ncbi:hypothetical protein, conserved [Eimeria brunetti]|uniref:Sulfhydryl oxidase n=1 Tax=Eimeria brunetti TaxID=51314 RepID=U6LP65_9EIME|nr:hypothetical protein, conserved [Eimeria brunetti]
MRSHPSNTSFGGVGTFSFTLLALLNLTFIVRPQPAVGEVVASLEVPPTANLNSPAGFLVDPTSATEDGLSSTAAIAAPTPRVPPRTAAAVAASTLKQSRGHRLMFALDPIVEEAGTAEEYRQVLRKARDAGKGLIIMFYSAWCPHCFTYKKTFSQLAMDLHNRFHFAALNCMEDEKAMDICSSLGIFALPSIKLFVPPSLHMQLPASEHRPKTDTQMEKNMHLESPGMHEGGSLDSFDASQPESFAIHSLALPSDDIYLAVQYAAGRTQQKIYKNELQQTLGGNFAAFEHLRGIPCSTHRWKSEQEPAPSAVGSSGPQQEEEETNRGAARAGLRMGDRDATSGASARARLHDGIRGLQFILASWVVTEGEHMSFAEEFALVDLLEIVRAVVPIETVKKSAALAIIHLYSSMQVSPDGLTSRQPESLTDASARFSEHIELYREIDDHLRHTKGLRTADWRKWIGGLSFGAEALPLPPLEEPKLKHCTTLTCSVWMLMHVLAEGARELSAKVNAHPKCGPSERFFKRKGQALPIYLLQQQQQQRRPVNIDAVIDTATLTTEALIEQNPSLGCMSVPAFEVAYSIYNFLQRFFGCIACRQHFISLFSMRSHGLDALSPPAGGALIRLPFLADVATLQLSQTQTSAPRASDSLLEYFRGQPRGSHSAWISRFTEANKMDELKLWLWRLHNAVTVRTAADTTLAFLKGDAEAVNYANCDTRWPPRAACTSCRSAPPPEAGLVSIPLLLARDANKDVLTVDEEFEDFNKAKVLAFLRQSYWLDGVEEMKI